MSGCFEHVLICQLSHSNLHKKIVGFTNEILQKGYEASLDYEIQEMAKQTTKILRHHIIIFSLTLNSQFWIWSFREWSEYLTNLFIRKSTTAETVKWALPFYICSAKVSINLNKHPQSDSKYVRIEFEELKRIRTLLHSCSCRFLPETSTPSFEKHCFLL